MTAYRTIAVDRLRIFYREAGPKDAPALLLRSSGRCDRWIHQALGLRRCGNEARRDEAPDEVATLTRAFLDGLPRVRNR